MKAINYFKLPLFAVIILSGNLILGYALYRNNEAFQDAAKWVQHTEDVIVQSDKIKLFSKNIATDALGFAVTRNSSLITSLYYDKREALLAIKKLQILTSDNRGQQKRIILLSAGMKDLINFAGASVVHNNNRQSDENIIAAAFKTENIYLERVETLINAIQKEEDQLLVVRKTANIYSLNVFNKLSAAMFTSLFGFSLLMLFILRKYLAQVEEKGQRAAELQTANKELIFQNDEKENRAAELVIANHELAFQNHEKESRAAELLIANQELLFQNKEKKNRASELVVANIELSFQNNEKENRAAELLLANIELSFQNDEKENRAAELIIANIELAFQNEEKAKRALELNRVNHLYAFISQISQHILHVKNERTLYRNSCKIALEFGAFKLAWIGLFEDDNTKINLVEQIGIPEGELHQFTGMTLAANKQQAGILATGSYYICNQIIGNNELKSWHPFTEKHNISSCMILPIKKAGITIGTFNLYAGDTDFFNKEEIELLVGLGDNISFALDGFEKLKKQQEAEELVIANERRFRALTEKSTDMLLISTIEGELLYSSPSIKRVLGYSVEELKNQSATDFIHPDDIEVFIKNRMAVSQTPGLTLTSQQQIKHKDGHWIWCEGTDNNLIDEPGIHAIVSNFRDITERKVLEQQQDFDGANQAALINNTKDLMWSIDRNFNLITSNKPFNDMVLLVSGKELKKGETVLSDVFSIAQLSRFKAIYERAFTGETFREYNYSRSPFEYWTDTSYAPIFQDDEVIGAVCHSRDITERKLAEETLRQSEKRLKEAQAIARIGNFEIDFNDSAVIWSEGMYEILGINSEDVTPSKEFFMSFTHPDDIDRINTIVKQAYQTFENLTYDYRFIPTNGDIRFGRTELQFYFDEHGKPTRLFGIVRDVTETKLAELERLKMVNDLIVRNKDLEQFAYIISHNLRAPIANIIGASDALKDEDLDLYDREMLNKGISVSVMRLDEVVQDLNLILQVKSQVNEQKETVILSELVEDIKTSIGNMIEKYGIIIRCDFSAINEFFTLKPYLYSIFYNLIINSVKYRQHDVPCLIEISSARQHDRLVLLFTDNGTGIDLEKKGDEVFGLYKKFHETGEGKGLGLFMVKTQVESLGGVISIRSSKNKGAEFNIVFDLS